MTKETRVKIEVFAVLFALLIIGYAGIDCFKSGKDSTSGSSALASNGTPADTYVIYFDNLTSVITFTVGTLKKVSIGGGTPSTIDTDVRNWEFTPDRTKIVYLSNVTASGIGNLKSVPVSGGSPTTIATNVRDWKISPDGTKIFYVGNYNPITYYGDLITIPISGGSPTTLVSGGYNLRVKQDVETDPSY